VRSLEAALDVIAVGATRTQEILEAFKVQQASKV